MLDISAFKKPALQLSGGKDSLACLFLLKDQLEHITVYWLNTGDTCPETVGVIESVKSWIPRFKEVKSDVHAWRDVNGMPSDLLPSSGHFIARQYGMGGQPITGRFDCCYHNIMQPMHQQMLADGVDLVIRGTKLCDGGRIPAEGDVGCYTVMLPVRDWSHEDVFAYLDEVGAPVNPIYQFAKGMSAPECLGCTAWWGDGKAAYLKAMHPHLFQGYKTNLMTLKKAALVHMDELNKELEA